MCMEENLQINASVDPNYGPFSAQDSNSINCSLNPSEIAATVSVNADNGRPVRICGWKIFRKIITDRRNFLFVVVVMMTTTTSAIFVVVLIVGRH